ncbi:MAG TPA: amino acid adenylation domain-containing protein, partial [Thermoanaerobaculia bacterium]|nr:amino acid adenylation domain-containing protein [Thermoanaerobaculia bacterium]
LRALLLLWSAESSRLVLTLPTLCADGATLQILAAETARIYGLFAGGAAAGGEADEIVQYTQFAEWQHDLAAQSEAEEGLSYWRGRLTRDELLPFLAAPMGAPDGGRRARLRLELDAGLSAGVAALARQKEASVAEVVQAAWRALLGRLSGGRPVEVRVLCSGRPYEDLAGMPGLCAKPLPVRAELPEDATFAEVLDETVRAVAEAEGHQDYLGLGAEEEGANPYDAGIVFEAVELPAPVAAGGARLTVLRQEVDLCPCDLKLSCLRRGGALELVLEHDPRLLDGSRAWHLASRLESLLRHATRDPEALVADLDLLGERERHRLLVELNDTAREVIRGEECVHRSVARKAAAAPEQIAVECAGRRLTYGELDAAAGRIARALARRGVGPEVVVGVAMGRCLELLPALLGILKAGGAYLPIDPAWPAARRSFVLGNGGAGLVLAGAAPEPGSFGAGVEVVDVWALLSTREEAAKPAPPDPASPATLAYVLYTSGSTGQPKGVMVTHRGLANYLGWCVGAYGLEAGRSVLVHSPVGFDLTVTALFTPLLCGATVSLLPEGEGLEGLCSALSGDEPLGLLKLTPAHLQALQGLLPVSRVADRLRTLVVGGEALHGEAVSAWLPADSALQVINEYGPTETVVGCCVHRVRPSLDLSGAVPIGGPIANTRLYVLDRNLVPVPAEIAGELHVAGAGLARGYLGRPDLTAERFLPELAGGSCGERMYRTGDLVRRLPDGVLEFLGRIDHQVKVRGYRIEPGEIEAALAEHPRLREVAVVPVPAAGAGRALGAFHVAHRGPVAAEELRAFLAERLPEHMIPAFFVPLDRLPLTGNGKIDRAALAAQGAGAGEPVGGSVAARTPIEEALVGIWASVLGRETVGVLDDFFQIGGHSLLATQLVARVVKTFAVDLTLPALFRAPTVAALAEEIARRKAEQGDGRFLPGEWPVLVPDPAGRAEPFPLTDVQYAYWIGRTGAIELGNVSSHGYLELDVERLDLDRLTEALRRLIDRHDMLRAVVRPDGLQQVLPEVPPFEVEVRDLRGLDPGDVEAKLLASREELSHQVLAADCWPLFAVRAALLDGERVRLQISRDALISDAWSGQILTRELIALYRDPGADLEPRRLTFRDYVLGEAAVRETEMHRRDLDYWSRRLETLPPAPELPLARDPATLDRPRFVRRRSSLDAAAWDRLRDLGARAGLTPSGIFLAAFAEVLCRWSKSPRFTISLTLFNRLPLHPEVDLIVGDFTSLVLIEVDRRESDSFALHARRIQEQLWEELDHRTVSGVWVLRELVRRSGGRLRALMPVVLTSTLAQPALLPADDVEGAPQGRVVYSITQTPQVWLDHQVFHQEGGVGFNWDFVDELFPEGLVEQMFDAYVDLVDRLASGEAAWQSAALGGLPGSHAALLAQVNETAGPIPEMLLHEPFLMQARRNGGQPAVVATDRTLTYRELDRATAALALRLRKAGAGPGHLVAVVAEKGWEQVVAVLAILRAGAAYLPVDPALPKKRLGHLLREGDVEIALTQPWLEGSLEWPEGVTPVAVLWTGDGGEAGDLDAALPVADRSNDALAYVIYTSGSTGAPKGVMIDHRGA